jgi:hypothetical protein
VEVKRKKSVRVSVVKEVKRELKECVSGKKCGGVWCLREVKRECLSVVFGGGKVL